MTPRLLAGRSVLNVKIGLPALGLLGIVIGVLGITYVNANAVVPGWILIVSGFACAALSVAARMRENRRLLRRWADEDNAEPAESDRQPGE